MNKKQIKEWSKLFGRQITEREYDNIRNLSRRCINGIKKKMKNKYTPEQIEYDFADMNEISVDQIFPLTKALSILEKDLVDKIVAEVYFICCHSGILGFHLWLKSEYLKGKKAIIFLSEEAFKGEEKDIRDRILHEVAHYVLKHKSVFDLDEVKMMDVQEVKADALVKKWLKQQR